MGTAIICTALAFVVGLVAGYVLGWIHGSRPLEIKSDAWRERYYAPREREGE